MQGNREGSLSGWSQASLQISWDRNADPRWEVDLLLAHQVVKPALDAWRHRIDFWRFHRRAVGDSDGHIFSFHVYSSSDTASAVFDGIRSNPILMQAKQHDLLLADTYSAGSGDVEGEAETYWADEIRKAWPYFIMGVSEMWLRLVDECVTKDFGSLEDRSIVDLLSLYRSADEEVTRLWSVQGCHAFIHHLNAAFGYKPVRVLDAWSVF